MQSLNITLALAVSLLTDIVERFGADHTVAGPGGCTYANRSGERLVPVCIVGQMVSDLGALRALATDNEGDPDGVFVGTCSLENNSFWDNLAEFGITADDDAKVFLRDAQTSQDSGYTWGRSVERAKRDITEHLHAEATSAVNDRLRNAGIAVGVVQPAEVLEDWERELLGE